MLFRRTAFFMSRVFMLSLWFQRKDFYALV